MPQQSDLLHFVRQSAMMVWRAAQSGSLDDLPEWRAMTGQTPAELAGDGWLDVIHKDDVERVRMAWQTAVLHGTEYNTEYRVKYVDGNFRWINSRGVPVFDEHGHVMYWVGAIFAVPSMLRVPKQQEMAAAPADCSKYSDITATALRMCRVALGMNAEEFAKAAEISISTVRRLEEHNREASSRKSTVQKIISYLKGRNLYLLGTGNIITGVDAGQIDQRSFSQH